ncbi:MAG TPA: hypothetical protein VHZ03_05360 [Trebonia sp.]|jgi:hypothetical protein|nr:hypothetical protein [Trebonia sp.]
MDGDRLDEGRWQSMERIAGRAASSLYSSPRPGWGHVERFDAALDAVVAYVAEYGWPDGENFRPLFQAARNGITNASRENVKHAIFGYKFWGKPASQSDVIGERITDKIGIWQVCWGLTENEWSAVWATAEVMKWGGSRQDAAALLRIPVGQLSDRLHRARLRAYQLWICPDETPPTRKYYSVHGGKRTKAENRRRNDAARGRRIAREEEAA